MGVSIFDVTMHYDQMAINYIRKKPSCLYIFMSSGAAYGSKFDSPVDICSTATVAINNFIPREWYSLAKLYAECRHRTLADLSIIDLRIFNYFSHTQDISSRFLITDIISSIIYNTILYTSNSIITRDYIHPTDFYQMIQRIINSSPTNAVVDCYSLSPVKKSEILDSMTEKFGLRYEVVNNNMEFDATGLKPNYYSLNRSAENFGYKPSLTSMEGLILETEKILTNDFNK
jgi:nucleoside-diphosphate-sugar epimerase